VLRLDKDLPQNVTSLLLERRTYLGAVQMCGPSHRDPRLGHVGGKVIGRVDDHRFQAIQDLRCEFRVGEGFSGGPVWRADTERVVGVLQSVAQDSDNGDVYLVGADVVQDLLDRCGTRR